jgi:tRNA threonylcarbamoyladenosine biosynthesis protein TsaE
MREESHITASALETVALGKSLSTTLIPPKVVILSGDLGAGKTTLVKGVVEGFQAAPSAQVTSPTFTLVHEYRSPQIDIYHIDLYRIQTLRELETLGLDDLVGERSLLLIEWGEKFERFRRECDVEILLQPLGESQRRISIRSRDN